MAKEPPHIFKPSNKAKGMRGYVRAGGTVRHLKSNKYGTHKRRSGKPHRQGEGAFSVSLGTIARKAKRGLFGLF